MRLTRFEVMHTSRAFARPLQRSPSRAVWARSCSAPHPRRRTCGRRTLRRSSAHRRGNPSLRRRAVEPGVRRRCIHVCECAACRRHARCLPGDAAYGTIAEPWRTYDRAQDAWVARRRRRHPLLPRRRLPDRRQHAVGRPRLHPRQPSTLGAYTPPWATGGEPAPRLVQTHRRRALLRRQWQRRPRGGLVVRDLDLDCTGCVTGNFGIFCSTTSTTSCSRPESAASASASTSRAPTRARRTPLDGATTASRCSTATSRQPRPGVAGLDRRPAVARNRPHNGSGSMFEHNLYLNQSNGATSASASLATSSTARRRATAAPARAARSRSTASTPTCSSRATTSTRTSAPPTPVAGGWG